MSNPLLPGSRIGIIGGGQLGRMSTQAAQRMGYRVVIFDPSPDAPAAGVAETCVTGSFRDHPQLAHFGQLADVATVEFENIPVDTLREIETTTRVAPHWSVLHVCQNRAREKGFLKSHGVPCAAFREVRSFEELSRAGEGLGYPSVLKTTAFGYDGKGQVKIESKDELEKAWAAVGGGLSVIEEWVAFEKEISVVVARGQSGAIAAFPVFENHHTSHILDFTMMPARISQEQATEAVAIAEKLATKLALVGLLTVEFFVHPKRGLLVNELAPRPHNSGHVTIEGCVTSQFEQLIRAVAGMPLGDPSLVKPTVMVNLLGDLWAHGEPDWATLLGESEIKLHLYGKKEARPGRKMGHLTLPCSDAEDGLKRLMTARSQLLRSAPARDATSSDPR